MRISFNSPPRHLMVIYNAQSDYHVVVDVESDEIIYNLSDCPTRVFPFAFERAHPQDVTFFIPFRTE